MTLQEKELEQAFKKALEAAFPLALRDEEMQEHLQDTPARMARAWRDFFVAEEPELTVFSARGRREFVIQSNIPFRSFCAHHMLPFIGTATVGYLPNNKIVGLSKLARVVDYLSAAPQTQEHLTSSIADYLFQHDNLKPEAVGVILNAEHMCMNLRGVEKHGVLTTTSALRGSLLTDASQRSEFMSFVPR